MKNFALGLLIGLLLLVTAAAYNKQRKAVAITINENLVYVLYDDGSVFANQGVVIDKNGWGAPKYNPKPWVNWSNGVADNSVAPQPYQP